MELTVIYVLIAVLAAAGLLLAKVVRSVSAKMMIIARDQDEIFERLVETEHRVEVLEHGQH